MARQTVRLVTCDVCGEEPASEYVLMEAPKRGRRSARSVDLCEEHASPIQDLLGRGRRVMVTLETEKLAPTVRRTARPATPSRKIYTAEELDQLERAGSADT